MVVHNLDKCLQRNPGSAKHTHSSTAKDLSVMIDRALSTDVYSRLEHREYKHYVNFGRSTRTSHPSHHIKAR